MALEARGKRNTASFYTEITETENVTSTHEKTAQTKRA